METFVYSLVYLWVFVRVFMAEEIEQLCRRMKLSEHERTNIRLTKERVS